MKLLKKSTLIKISVSLVICLAMTITTASAQVGTSIQGNAGIIVISPQQPRDFGVLNMIHIKPISSADYANTLHAKIGEGVDVSFKTIAPVSFSAESEDELLLRKSNFLRSSKLHQENNTVHVLDSFKAY